LNVPAPYYGVFNPKAVFNLKKTLTNAGYTTASNALSEIGNEALRNGYVGRVAGIDMYLKMLTLVLTDMMILSVVYSTQYH
jgi:hypothetical protein